MKEIVDVIRAFDAAQHAGRQTALATVVHVDGSAYRRPGARMLIDDTGQLTGAISGGCLEGDALRKAMMVLSRQRSMLVTYDTRDDDDAKFGVGLGCNGIIQVLIEPIDSADANNPLALLKALTNKRQEAALITLFSLQRRNDEQPGTCMLLKGDGEVLAKNSPLREALLKDAKEALINRTSSFKNYDPAGQNLLAFIEFIKPPVSLIVIGAGNDVMPMVSMADILGWQTTVIDARPNYAKPERFPAACSVIVSKPEQVLDRINFDEQTVFVLMTHNYNYDLAMLRALISRKVPYIGSLGPKKKMDRMQEELKSEGARIDEQSLSHIYGPSGLDIGAETPEEIALSILAEIKAVLAGRCGQSLRNNGDVIHSRAATSILQINLEK